jgi:WD40 repeat protein
VPIWLQALILLLLSLPLLLLRPYVGHTDRVNSVHFLGDKQIFSGSEDCTIRRWDITVKDQLFRSQDTYGIKPEGQLEMELPELCRGQDNQFKTKGTLAYANDAVQAIVSFQNKQNNDFWVAAGLLDTGMIQLYNVFNNDKTCPPLKDPNSDVDRVLALVLNRNATTLYSGHGSNKIRVWQRNETGCFDLDPKIGSLSLGEQEVYEIRALALSRDDNQIVSAGSGERLLVWDDLANLDANLSGSGPSPTIAPDRQILASLDDLDPIQNIWDIAFLPDSSILATANSNGYIILWDSSKCAPFQGELFRCDDHDYWQAIKDGDASFRSVRSLKFSQDGRYLVSGGDDGRVMLWPIDPDHKLERIEGIPSKGQVIFEGNQPISSVDLLETNAGLFIASGSQDHRVRLHHEVLEKSEEEEDVSTPTTVPNLPESGVIDLNNLDPNNPQAIPTNPP